MALPLEESYFIGVDVGTNSVRAALVSPKGRILRHTERKITIWNPQPDFYQQSSVEIWQAVVNCIKEVILEIPKEIIKGIGFTGTCSLVIIDKNDQPVSIDSNGKNDYQNVILWMDHRAQKQADFINTTQHPLLSHVGGKVSPEMQIPKIRWLKDNLTDTHWNRIAHYFDLPDFLTWKATGSTVRSLCSLVCKWNYSADDVKTEWSSEYLNLIGLADLTRDNYKRIGQSSSVPGAPVGRGLSLSAAKELGLIGGCPVGASLIDAHAGCLGMLGVPISDMTTALDNNNNNVENRLCVISGTSTCHLVLSKDVHFIQGVWGPYRNAILADWWLHEGGQSATGKLIDHVIEMHPASSRIQTQKLHANQHIQQYLNCKLIEMAQGKREAIAYLTRKCHVYPDFHGNRSPLADPLMTGSICGLTLMDRDDDENLALIYLATIQALCYGTRHILETLTANRGSPIDALVICGGLSKNPIFLQTQSDVVQLPILVPEERESVLLGAAILGANASKADGRNKLIKTAFEMAGKGAVSQPNINTFEFHQKKYRVFLEMLQDQRKYRDIMQTKD